MNSMKITPPEGYEVDKDKSTFEEIVFKPITPTYNKISKELFGHAAYYITTKGSVGHTELLSDCEHLPNNAVSAEQVRKILALNQLINVTAYFNSKRDLVLNRYYTIVYNKNSDSYDVYSSGNNYTYGMDIIFKDKKDAWTVINNPNLRDILDKVYK